MDLSYIEPASADCRLTQTLQESGIQVEFHLGSKNDSYPEETTVVSTSEEYNPIDYMKQN